MFLSALDNVIKAVGHDPQQATQLVSIFSGARFQRLDMSSASVLIRWKVEGEEDGVLNKPAFFKMGMASITFLIRYGKVESEEHCMKL